MGTGVVPCIRRPIVMPPTTSAPGLRALSDPSGPDPFHAGCDSLGAASNRAIDDLA